MVTSQKLLLASLLFCVLQCQAMKEDTVGASEISFIYYPSKNLSIKTTGHAKLEVNGCIWTMLGDPAKSRSSLQNRIDKSTSNGRPFFRFVFQVTPDQMAIIEKAITNGGSCISCSAGALAPLTEADACTIPAPVTISPLVSAVYLSAVKMAGINNIKRIEYYGNPSMIKNAFKMVPGVATETFLVTGAVRLMAARL